MKQKFDSKQVEIIIYSLIWMLIFLMPVFFTGNEYRTDWNRVFNEWIRFIPFLLIFLINNTLLVPKLLFEKKYQNYLISLITIILLVSLIASWYNKMLSDLIHGFARPEIRRFRQQLPPPPVVPQPWHIVFINNIIISFLIAGFNTAIKLSFQWAKDQQDKRELEKEHLQTELSFLKHQISPHFFMNTLNNIHALIDIEKEDAKDAIIRLSKMMRHLLYDSEQGQTSLNNEIDFIKSYLELMQLRYSSKVVIKTSFPEKTDDYKIPPLLFTSLIENAFKHGVSYRNDSFLNLSIKLENNYLHFNLINSINKNEHLGNMPGGIGLANLKKRLQLIYGYKYEFSISNSEKEFHVNLKIPVYEN